MKRNNPTEKSKVKEKYKAFSEKQLLEYPEVQTWLRTVSEGTSKLYIKCLEKFCNWSKKSPKQLILDRDKELKSSNPNGRTGTRNLILDFRKHLEEQGYAPKSINTFDGCIRGFYTAVLGKTGMINLKNYRNCFVSTRKDLVPTLEEVKKMLDAVGLEEKFRILFIAQTGMRVSDAIEIKVGDIKRELELEKVPLAIRFVPKKDREMIGERITFLASDGIDMLKQYLE